MLKFRPAFEVTFTIHLADTAVLEDSMVTTATPAFSAFVRAGVIQSAVLHVRRLDLRFQRIEAALGEIQALYIGNDLCRRYTLVNVDGAGSGIVVIVKHGDDGRPRRNGGDHARSAHRNDIGIAGIEAVDIGRGLHRELKTLIRVQLDGISCKIYHIAYRFDRQTKGAQQQCHDRHETGNSFFHEMLTSVVLVS